MPTKLGIVKFTPAGGAGAAGVGVVAGGGATAWEDGGGATDDDWTADVDEGAASTEDAVSFFPPLTADPMRPMANRTPRTIAQGFLYQGVGGGAPHPCCGGYVAWPCGG
jgi:hypothetical protein